MAAVAQNVNRTVRFFSDVLRRPLTTTPNRILSQEALPSAVTNSLLSRRPVCTVGCTVQASGVYL